MQLYIYSDASSSELFLYQYFLYFDDLLLKFFFNTYEVKIIFENNNLNLYEKLIS